MYLSFMKKGKKKSEKKHVELVTSSKTFHCAIERHYYRPWIYQLFCRRVNLSNFGSFWISRFFLARCKNIQKNISKNGTIG